MSYIIWCNRILSDRKGSLNYSRNVRVSRTVHIITTLLGVEESESKREDSEQFLVTKSFVSKSLKTFSRNFAICVSTYLSAFLVGYFRIYCTVRRIWVKLVAIAASNGLNFKG